ncbi:MAG: ketoacyl-ACP synthase III [Bacteroidia bacterium]|nr:ketoacyl-ACP synthase III [Bacteroidia bacterium]MCF8445934.1 ketoacyl-ACP synthase III [Bacteroidia bacterium]
MLVSRFKGFKIGALSVAVPSHKIQISDFYESFGKDLVDKFSEMAGVKQIAHTSLKQTASDLGFIAAEKVFESGKAKREDIGVLVFVSQKPDFRIPATSFVLQKRLGLGENVICQDINLACSGFIFGLQTSLSILSNLKGKKALLITADTSYKTMSPQDRTMFMLFGDSGSAVVLEKDDLNREQIFELAFRTNGDKFKSIITPAGAFRNRNLKPIDEVWSDDIVRNDYNTHMKGMAVFEFSITDVPKLINDFYKYTNTDASSYDNFILHQANLYILKQLSRKCKIPFEKIPLSIDRFGNNSSNSIPLVLSDHFSNADNKTLRLLISGFGAGLSWACGAINIDTQNILPIFISDDFFIE